MVIDDLFGGQRSEICGRVTIADQQNIEAQRNCTSGSGVDAELGHATADRQTIYAKFDQTFLQAGIVERVA
ncbi:hypothetical protein ANI02nite_21440 [Acetobacter nitrogenifigens DSM 23921 = NBRC 105050]|uniref:Uncharacterized protein n=1 Tax=Acetobacter nitrogenifigens DSM 23921 = NBRC 105050 TaxID=1120919 RepID=A0A511XBE4_9PROT|nr:hypothetical protein ANI02nite_21440 [Acetobacter nitrogenifigens DSM 23921 = NBRC 105050]